MKTLKVSTVKGWNITSLLIDGEKVFFAKKAKKSNTPEPEEITAQELIDMCEKDLS